MMLLFYIPESYFIKILLTLIFYFIVCDNELKTHEATENVKLQGDKIP